MLGKATATQEVMRRLRKMQAGDSLELLTWKKDRSLLLFKQSKDEIVVYERGFVEDEYRIKFGKLKKLLKREFPRSHKIRIKAESGK
ncbi:MAG: hypothetical protein U9P36_05765 [Thermodesulfobacteriota bacterium]|nr:hypothetical protein [Thermodesulfobacteriota bacterium]